MKSQEIKSLIKSRLAAIYDTAEVEAIARAYVEDKLQPWLNKGNTIQSAFDLPDFFHVDMNRLVSGAPLQYVTGIQYFSGQIFKVNESVLIPRPETEELVAWILEDLQSTALQPDFSLIDIGTGSGCIPVSLKMKNPSAKITATDISPQALHVATENAKLHDVEINFLEASILNHTISQIKYDVIVSNPPYIPLSDAGGMSANVINHEPHLALFVPDDDPLFFYKAICEFATQHLKMNGLLYFEINPPAAEQLVEYLKTSGFGKVISRNDLSGHTRFIRASQMKVK